MELEKEFERRSPPHEYKCTKLDAFNSINETLERIELKVDGLSIEMRTMIKLEQQQITQSKDIERLSKTVEELREQNKQLSDRLLELRSNFENQKQSISMIERIGWAAGTIIAVIIGKQLGIS